MFVRQSLLNWAVVVVIANAGWRPVVALTRCSTEFKHLLLIMIGPIFFSLRSVLGFFAWCWCWVRFIAQTTMESETERERWRATGANGHEWVRERENEKRLGFLCVCRTAEAVCRRLCEESGMSMPPMWVCVSEYFVKSGLCVFAACWCACNGLVKKGVRNQLLYVRLIPIVIDLYFVYMYYDSRETLSFSLLSANVVLSSRYGCAVLLSNPILDVFMLQNNISCCGSGGSYHMAPLPMFRLCVFVLDVSLIYGINQRERERDIYKQTKLGSNNNM